MSKSYWLFKTEPETYSFDQLIKDKSTAWSGVRNFQARNYLQAIKKDDLVLIYHSGADKSVVGIAKVIGTPYPEVDTKKAGDWVQVDIAAVKPLPKKVTLAQIKASPALEEMFLIKQSRLSVMPVTLKQFQFILTLGAAS